jgi:hypothetical protein
MRADCTVVYYSSNREDPRFEARVQELLLDAADGLPIVSVTQKPTKLGENICVGEQVACYANVIRQALIGLRAANTTFVINAEADMVFSRDYFSWTPPRTDRIYRYPNVWILAAWPGKTHGAGFHFKGETDLQIAGREYWISCLERCLDHPEIWPSEPEWPKRNAFDQWSRLWSGGEPCVIFKTKQGLTNWTAMNPQHAVEQELPPWGTVEQLRKRMWPEGYDGAWRNAT